MLRTLSAIVIITALVVVAAACSRAPGERTVGPAPLQIPGCADTPSDPAAALRPPLVEPALPGRAADDYRVAMATTHDLDEAEHVSPKEIRAAAVGGAMPAALVALAARPDAQRVSAAVRQGARRADGASPFAAPRPCSERVGAPVAALRTTRVVTAVAVAEARAGRGRDAAVTLLALARMGADVARGGDLLAWHVGASVRERALDTLAALHASGAVSVIDMAAVTPIVARLHGDVPPLLAALRVDLEATGPMALVGLRQLPKLARSARRGDALLARVD